MLTHAVRAAHEGPPAGLWSEYYLGTRHIFHVQGLPYHARMARRAQHLLCEGSERADSKLDKYMA